MIELESFKYYFRRYACERPADAPALWWFERQTGRVLCVDELPPDRISNGPESPYTCDLIPIGGVEMEAMESRFMAERGLAGDCQTLAADGDPDSRFKAYADRHGLMDDWHRYEGEQLLAAARTWCRMHGIRTNEK